MTEIVLKERGVVLQYLGDGILACWNVPFADADHVDRACRAALDMTRRLGEVTDGWRCGIGMHTGEVVAGALGSDQIFSYSLIGAVVNQASRVEGLTKLLDVPVLVTAQAARQLSPSTGSAARMGRFIPAGMDSALELFALRGPGDGSAPADAVYAAALAAFERGDWDETLRHLGELRPEYGPGRFLAAQAIEKKRYPPSAWDGVMKITQK